MAYYLLQVTYTSEAWAALIQNPQNRLEAVRPAVERLGGHIDGAWLAFGEYDVVALFQMPDHVSQAAISIAIAAGGAAKAVRTTPLMTFEEGMEALGKAARVAGTVYRPPSV